MDIHLEPGNLPIGGGAIGIVFKGHYRDLSIDVAVKFFESRSEREKSVIQDHARSLADLDHPNVLRVYGIVDLVRPDCVGAEPEPALIMEYLDGISLGDWLRHTSRPSVDCIRVIRGLLSGLAAFHEKDLVHGDLHAGNVIVTNSRVKIIDPVAAAEYVGLTTASKQNSQKSDIRHAWDLIRVLASASDDVSLSRRFYRAIVTLDGGVGSLMQDVESLIETRESVDDRSMFDVNIRLLSDGQRATVDAAVQIAVQNQLKTIQDWSEVCPKGLTQYAEIRAQIDIAIERLSGSHGLVYAGACCSNPIGSRTLSVLKRLLSIHLSDNTQSMVPPALAHIVSVVAGSAAMRTGSTGFVKSMFETRFRDAGGKRLSFFESGDLCGWPHGIAQSCFDVWKYVSGLYPRYTVLRSVFVTESAWFSAMMAYSATAAFYSYLRHGRGNSEWVSGYAPVFCRNAMGAGLVYQSAVEGAVEYLEETAGLLDLLYGGLGVAYNPAEAASDWENFLKIVEKYNSQGSSWGFNLGHEWQEVVFT